MVRILVEKLNTVPNATKRIIEAYTEHVNVWDLQKYHSGYRWDWDWSNEMTALRFKSEALKEEIDRYKYAPSGGAVTAFVSWKGQLPLPGTVVVYGEETARIHMEQRPTVAIPGEEFREKGGWGIRSGSYSHDSVQGVMEPEELCRPASQADLGKSKHSLRFYANIEHPIFKQAVTDVQDPKQFLVREQAGKIDNIALDTNTALSSYRPRPDAVKSAMSTEDRLARQIQTCFRGWLARNMWRSKKLWNMLVTIKEKEKRDLVEGHNTFVAMLKRLEDIWREQEEDAEGCKTLAQWVKVNQRLVSGKVAVENINDSDDEDDDNEEGIGEAAPQGYGVRAPYIPPKEITEEVKHLLGIFYFVQMDMHGHAHAWTTTPKP